MPIYEFQCKECKEIKDIIMSLKEWENQSSQEVILEHLTCDCGGIREQVFVTAPAVSTMIQNRTNKMGKRELTQESKAKIKKDRKKRSIDHFHREIYPTLPKSEKKDFAKKHGWKL